MKEYIDVKDIKELKTGDVVRNHGSGLSYMVLVNYGTRATAVRVADITNPTEWQVLTCENAALKESLKEARALLDNIMDDMKEEGGQEWYTNQIEALIDKASKLL